MWICYMGSGLEWRLQMQLLLNPFCSWPNPTLLPTYVTISFPPLFHSMLPCPLLSPHQSPKVDSFSKTSQIEVPRYQHSRSTWIHTLLERLLQLLTEGSFCPLMSLLRLACKNPLCTPSLFRQLIQSSTIGFPLVSFANIFWKRLYKARRNA